MRIERHRLSFRRRRRRRNGCLPATLLLGIVLGLLIMSWGWVSRWFDPGQLIVPPTASLDAAHRAFAAGDLDNAIAQARAIWAAQPARIDALDTLARALVYRSYSDFEHEGDRRAALDLTAEAVAARTDNDLVALHAYVLQANGQPVTAAETAARVLEQNPDHALARVALALGYSGVGSHELALREARRAAEAPDWRLDTLRALALAYSGVGDYTNALATIDRAIAINNKLSHLHFERALFARQLGDADTATVAYFQILAHDGTNVKARLRLCELSSVLREREAAIDYCTQVTELAPNFAGGWYQLGREYFLQGDFAQAQTNFDQCATLQVMQDVPASERRFECWYLQGQAAEIRGDCPALLRIYNEYLTMVADGGLSQTWVYPPEGPPLCVTPQN
jgi:tetratricopeptide (TPR) repeat protein